MPGVQEMLVIAVVALMAVGPERLPRLARDAARLLARLRRETSQAMSELKSATAYDELDQELADIRRQLHGTRRDVQEWSRDDATPPSAIHRTAAIDHDGPPAT